MKKPPPIVSFVAPSGSGKTTLLEGVIACLSRRGLRIGAVKHHAHRIELDTPGKDTWRLRAAGASATVLAGADQIAIFDLSAPPPSLRRLVELFLGSVDIVLAEGFRSAEEPAILIRRAERPLPPDWKPPTHTIAVVSDTRVPGPLPVLDLNRPSEIADFLYARFLAGRPDPSSGAGAPERKSD